MHRGTANFQEDRRLCKVALDKVCLCWRPRQGWCIEISTAQIAPLAVKILLFNKIKTLPCFHVLELVSAQALRYGRTKTLCWPACMWLLGKRPESWFVQRAQTTPRVKSSWSNISTDQLIENSPPSHWSLLHDVFIGPSPDWIINSQRYYRMCLTVPWRSQASWCCRDRYTNTPNCRDSKS